ncbi:gypsy retrotransposon integrase 1 [Labeo rohita]|uniref:Gypsy retrotransposon integrase-like protein 1 n=1 Tax=Labeo rohita TaxID=84645 RepID=A0A498MDI1_LABRO|nr:gypsy retrotransposon integrase 1 [Labeo rohita]
MWQPSIAPATVQKAGDPASWAKPAPTSSRSSGVGKVITLFKIQILCTMSCTVDFGMSKAIDTTLYDAAWASQYRNTSTSISVSQPWSKSDLKAAMRDVMDCRKSRRLGRRRQGEGGLAKVICCSEEAKQIFKEFHTSPIGAHCGIVKTTDAISNRFYWPSMSVDIRNWVRHCAACQSKQAQIKNQADYTPIEVVEPWDIVGTDLVGKLTPTKDGYQYICVIIDYFTKWCEAFPLKTKSAEEVTGCIIKLFYRFGAPKRLLTDQGTEFVNKVINAYLTLLTKNYTGKGYVLDSYQASNLWNGSGSSMKRLDPGKYDVVIGSINENNHWKLMVCFFPVSSFCELK